MNPDPLAELRELALPNAIGVWPPAIGWWIVSVLIIAILALIIYYLRKKIALNRWRKLARIELKKLRDKQERNTESDDDLLIASSQLFRRVALQIDSRTSIAVLSGWEWAKKLDELSATTEFTQGRGKVLASDIWKKPKSSQSQQLTQVFDLLEEFIKRTKVKDD